MANSPILLNKVRSLFRLLRPFTLLAPAIGGLFFGLMGIKAAGLSVVQSLPLLFASGFILAMANATSNIMNQVFDLEVDSLHPEKRKRPIPSGELSSTDALAFAIFLMLLVVSLAGVLFGSYYTVSLSVILFFSWIYNCPPIRMKKRFILSNIAIAAPRGGLGITCAYSAFASPFNPMMYVAMIYFALYVFGTNTLKDFADAPYDKQTGIRNFVTVLGPVRAKEIVGFFLVIPWFFLLAVNCFMPINMVNFLPLLCSGLLISFLLRDEGRKSVEGNSLLWVMFYFQFSIMMILFAVPLIL